MYVGSSEVRIQKHTDTSLNGWTESYKFSVRFLHQSRQGLKSRIEGGGNDVSCAGSRDALLSI